MRYLFILSTLLIVSFPFQAQQAKAMAEEKDTTDQKKPTKPKVIFGIASYYADKFNGRPTANGEIYDGKKMTAACNQLPLGTWIRVTNLNNNRSVIVKTNDRLHIRMKRVVDLSRAAAEKLGYIGRGLTKVKVEVLEKK
jgi:rare lipoprotein A